MSINCKIGLNKAIDVIRNMSKSKNGIVSIFTFLFLSIWCMPSFAGNKLPKNVKTPLQILRYEMGLNGYNPDTIFLFSPIYDEIDDINDGVCKALKIKTPVTVERGMTASELLTAIMKTKYGKKSNVKNDFFAIRYSTNSDDFSSYLEKYPKSKYFEEAQSKWLCLRDNDSQMKAKQADIRPVYEEFAKQCANTPVCTYEGYEEISMSNLIKAESVGEWYQLIERSKGNNPLIYKDYADYISKYGENSFFAKSASDSLELNQDKYDWELSTKANTLDSYKQYLSKHAMGRYAWRAENLVKEMEAWQECLASGKYEDYCAYYTEFPDGMYSEKAIVIIKQHEEDAWHKTAKVNTLEAYETFVKQYPSGYYSNEARNKITDLRLAPYLKNDPSFNSISTVGYYSHPGYSLICVANVDVSKVITVSLTGPTGYSKSISPGQCDWIRVKNGSYKILVQASSVENWWGNAKFEDKIYAEAWYTTEVIMGHKFNHDNSLYLSRIKKEIQDKAEEELIKTIKYIYQ